VVAHRPIGAVELGVVEGAVERDDDDLGPPRRGHDFEALLAQARLDDLLGDRQQRAARVALAQVVHERVDRGDHVLRRRGDAQPRELGGIVGRGVERPVGGEDHT
jgi:hypothetical protein